MVNTNMLRARRGESTDEWYTTWPVVDRELSRHMDGLRGARVYCNCDGPESMFAQWFAMHYTQLGLAGLRLSRFNPASHTLFAPDASGDTWEWDGAGWVHARLQGNGSFDSVECLRFAAQADVVCTNPPFSLLGQYLPLMVEHARHVLVLGNMNAVKYHGVFPLMMGGRLRLGYDTGRMGFMVHGERPAVLSTARWFTTLPVERAPFHPQGTGEGLPVFDAHPDVVCVWIGWCCCRTGRVCMGCRSRCSTGCRTRVGGCGGCSRRGRIRMAWGRPWWVAGNGSPAC